jgi:hypothetical protein
LDVKLQLGPEDLSPSLLRKVVREGGRDSFPEARKEVQEHLALELDARQVQRHTERIGGEWRELRDAEVEAFKQGKLPRAYAGVPKAAAVMVDSGRVLTRAEAQPAGVHAPQWRGPKYACCLSLDSEPHKSDPQPEPPSKFLDRERVPKLVREMQSRAGNASAPTAPVCRAAKNKARKKKLRKRKKLRPGEVRRLVRTAVASMACASEFGYMAAAETHRRSLDLASRKAFVCDGELSNWTIWEQHFQKLGFVPILDFLHLLSYLYSAACALGGTPNQEWARYEVWLGWAWSGEREKVWAALCAASSKAGAPPQDAPEQDRRRVLQEAARYVEHNLTRMDYPRYRRLGLPVSSAPVESLIKQFNRRVKGTEKFWLEEGVEAVLQVRAAYLSEDGRAERYWSMPRPHYPAVGRNRLALAA